MLNRKKIIRGWIFFVVALPVVAMATETLGSILDCGGPCGLSDVLRVIQGLNNYIAFTLVPPVAILAFMYAGFIMVMGTGNPGEVKRGKDIMNNTIYGMIMVFAAYFIVDLIVGGLSGGTADSTASQLLGQ